MKWILGIFVVIWFGSWVASLFVDRLKNQNLALLALLILYLHLFTEVE